MRSKHQFATDLREEDKERNEENGFQTRAGENEKWIFDDESKNGGRGHGGKEHR